MCMYQRELIALLVLSSGCPITVNVLWLYSPCRGWVCIFIMVFSDNTHLLVHLKDLYLSIRFLAFKNNPIYTLDISVIKMTNYADTDLVLH